MCNRCHAYWNTSVSDVTYWASVQLGVSEGAIRAADELSQEEFQRIVLGGEESPDLPPGLPIARWAARRLALRA